MEQRRRAQECEVQGAGDQVQGAGAAQLNQQAGHPAQGI